MAPPWHIVYPQLCVGAVLPQRPLPSGVLKTPNCAATCPQEQAEARIGSQVYSNIFLAGSVHWMVLLSVLAEHCGIDHWWELWFVMLVLGGESLYSLIGSLSGTGLF